jgi:multidrug efflux pump subunit AcrB
VALRVSGQLDSVAAVSGLPLRVAGPNGAQTLRLGDIAAVKRGYADPAVTKMRFGGREAIGLAVSMVGNGDVLQLKSFSRTFMVVLTAPLGVVGVALALLVFRQPFGFVALLGVIALAGMIMRNSVILVDQIEREIDAGSPPWIAIREAAVRRFRPIVLTAAAAVLAMIPLTRSVLWGPMAYSIMGGLILATALTLLFLPALYAAWFRVKRPA